MTTNLNPTINPSTGKFAIAVLIDGMHCGFASDYNAAEALAQEIEAARSADAPQDEDDLRIDIVEIDYGEAAREAADKAEAAYAYFHPRLEAAEARPCFVCGGEGDCPVCNPVEAAAPACKQCGQRPAEAGQRRCSGCTENAIDLYEAEWLQDETSPAVAEAAAEIARKTAAPAKPRRRKAPKPCTCPQCQPGGHPYPNGVYRCSADKAFVAYHTGILVASGEYRMHVEIELNNHCHTLLSRPLPDASSDVLAAQNIAA